uniref:Uncharacterized protein n=1 Tax=Picea sitchensis TaxID=3332 RepID=A9NUZ7_PICSI|nr:unknown [Picea sitchensis]
MLPSDDRDLNVWPAQPTDFRCSSNIFCTLRKFLLNLIQYIVKFYQQNSSKTEMAPYIEIDVFRSLRVVHGICPKPNVIC